jgi:aspartate/methionine/tyrosine aminotransferase
VLRLDSFSKMMAPGFRLGWITGPPGLLHYYRKHCYASSQWGQLGPLHYIVVGLYQRPATTAGKKEKKQSRFRVFSLPGLVRNLKPTRSLPID